MTSPGRPPWHPISSTDARRLTGRPTWALARDRMEVRGWRAFPAGTCRRNMTQYLAADVICPTQEFWEACRDFLVEDGRCTPDAIRARVWDAVCLAEEAGIYGRPARRPLSPLIEPWFWDGFPS